MEWQNTAGIATQSFAQLALIQARVLHLSNLNTVVSTYSSLSILGGWVRVGGTITKHKK